MIETAFFEAREARWHALSMKSVNLAAS